MGIGYAEFGPPALPAAFGFVDLPPARGTACLWVAMWLSFLAGEVQIEGSSSMFWDCIFSFSIDSFYLLYLTYSYFLYSAERIYFSILDIYLYLLHLLRLKQFLP